MRRIFFSLTLLLSSFSVIAQTDTVPGVNNLLQLSLEELMNIQVVTASGYLQTTAEAPSTITLITEQKIAERGYEQLEDALRDVPGIDMIHINGYAPTLVYFRGMYGAENQRALLMIDGIGENNIIGSNDMAGPAYSLHNVERIEIIWGPASALYGANAFGGVINIITKKGADINGVQVKRGFGSFNTSFGNLLLGVKKSNFEFTAGASLYSTDGPKFTNRDPQYSASYFDKAYSLNTSLSYYGKRAKTTLGFRTYKTPSGWGTYANSPTAYLGLPPQGNGNVGLVGVLQRDIRGERSGLIDSYLRTVFLQNEFAVNKKLNIFSRIVYRQTGTGDDSYVYITLDSTKLYRAIVASFSNRISGEVSANYTINEDQRLTAGMQFYQDNVEQGSRMATFDPTVHLLDGKDTLLNLGATFLTRKYDIRNNFGSYLQYILNTKLLTKTSFTAGIRYDYNSYFKSAVSPRIVIVNNPNDKLTLKLQFGMAFRAPTNLEIHQTGLNFKLTTEKIKTYEVNAIYAFSKAVRLQLNGFRNILTDVIILGNLSGFNPDKNPGIFKITGVETNLDMEIKKNLTGFFNFTYQYPWGKNLVSGNSGQLPGVARIKANAGISVQVADLFTFSILENHIGKRGSPRTNPYGPVKGYYLTNCTLSTAELFNKGVTVSLSVRNLFDTKWLDPGFRTADGLLYSTVLEQPGINGLFKIGIKL
ncbi:MAG: TonB-dependent receptor plug domain-containing protein [Bacteroidota bacterium]